MNRTSIRKRLIVSLIVLSVTPLLLLGTILTWNNFIIQQKQAEALQREASRLALHKIKYRMTELESELHLMTMTSRLMETSYGELHSMFSIYRSHKTRYHKEIINEVSLLDKRGNETIRVSRSSVYTPDDLVSKSSSPEFTIPFTTAQSYYSPVSVNTKTGEPYLIIAMPVKNVRDDSVQGILTANIRLKFMWDLIAEVPTGEEGAAYLLTDEGRVIAHPNPSIVLRGTFFDHSFAPGIREGLTGEKAVMASEKMSIGNLNLHIVTERPVYEALKQTYISTLTIISFLLLTLGGIIAFGIVVVRKIVQPVEMLSQTARAISSGDLSQRAEVHSDDEIGTLGSSFNTMTSKLVELIDSLEQRIAERDNALSSLYNKTNELKFLNQSLTREIGDRKEAQKALNLSHERLLLTLDSLDAIVYVSDLETNELLFINRHTHEVFGDVEGKTCWAVLQSGQSGPCRFCSNDKLLDSEGMPGEIIKREIQNTSNKRWYYTIDRAIRWVDGRMVRIEIATDITERKHAEDLIKDSLKEKEVLLKEVHHRVKNNMQVISSLLNLQAEIVNDSRFMEILDDSRNRIKSMALVHEKLYQSKDLAKINFGDYINSLVKSLFHFYGIDISKISPAMDIDNIMLSIDTAVPCGLIINELVSNALKHAFNGDMAGEIGITFNRKTSSDSTIEYSIVVRDDGVGIPEYIDIRETDTLGLKLVTNLVEHQLQGNISIHRNGGTKFHINFNEPEYKRRI